MSTTNLYRDLDFLMENTEIVNKHLICKILMQLLHTISYAIHLF